VLAALLETWGFRVTLQEVVDGRPNVVARIGRAGGRSLMFNGHLDVVGVDGMTHPPFEGATVDGRLYGRGATDMKGGVAAMCARAWRAAQAGLAGEIVIAAVVDEEWQSAGHQGVDRARRARRCVHRDRAHAPRDRPLAQGLHVDRGHFAGRAAHGSRYDVGVDAIRHCGLLLAELDRLEREELVRHTHPLLGQRIAACLRDQRRKRLVDVPGSLPARGGAPHGTWRVA
jgi:acetylornithine deacetylase